MSGCLRERDNDWGEILGGLALVGLPSPSTDIPSSILLVLMSAQKNHNICDTEYGKGWLAIAKLKPLSLFISLFQNCQMLS